MTCNVCRARTPIIDRWQLRQRTRKRLFFTTLVCTEKEEEKNNDKRKKKKIRKAQTRRQTRIIRICIRGVCGYKRGRGDATAVILFV